MPTERQVVVDIASRELRRRLGPTAWVVFEELLLLATTTTPTAESGDECETCTACVSVRSLAGRVGLAKDTVARALVRLRHAGLVHAHQPRTSRGVFTAGSYTITIPPVITLTATAGSNRARTRATRPRPTAHRASCTDAFDQLELTLDL